MGPRAGGYKLQSGQGGLEDFPSHRCRFADILFREHWPGTHFYNAVQEGGWEALTMSAMTKCNGTQLYSIIPSSLTRLWDSLSSSIGLSNLRAFLLFELPLTSIIYLELPPSTPLNSPLTPM